MNLIETRNILSLEQALSERTVFLKGTRTSQQLPKLLPKLRTGEILLDYEILSNSEALVQVQMLLNRSHHWVWNQLSTYENWTELLPNIVASSVVDGGYPKRIRQAAGFQLLGLVPQVQLEMLVRERDRREILFEGVSGSFKAFQAAMTLQDCHEGVLLTYFVEAKLLLPMPKVAIEQGILKILPQNLKALRAKLRLPTAA